MSSFQRDVGLIISHESILFTLHEANFLKELCYNNTSNLSLRLVLEIDRDMVNL